MTTNSYYPVEQWKQWEKLQQRLNLQSRSLYEQSITVLERYPRVENLRISSLDELKSHSLSKTAIVVILHIDQYDLSFWKKAVSAVKESLRDNVSVILVSELESESAILDAIEAGACDFVASTSSVMELCARINLIWNKQTKRVYGELTFDLELRVLFKYSKPLTLTNREFELALYLFSNPHKVHPREVLLSEVWGISSSLDTRRVDTHISRVRKRLGLNTADSRWRLRAIYQVGYILEVNTHFEISECRQ